MSASRVWRRGADALNGDCDFALMPMTPDYVEDLLWYMGEVARMRRADESLYSIELWDAVSRDTEEYVGKGRIRQVYFWVGQHKRWDGEERLSRRGQCGIVR
jgi:hypothetical protein